MKLTYLALLWGFLGNLLCAQHLIFRSGFEPGTKVVTYSNGDADITGTDRSVAAPNDWDALEQSDYIGDFYIQYKDGEGNQRWKRGAGIVDDPTGSGRGRVLKYWLLDANSSNGNGRVQANFYRGETGIREYYHRFKLYLPSESFQPLLDHPSGFGFLTIIEIWNNQNWSDGPAANYPFRISINISRRDDPTPSLRLRATAERGSTTNTGSWSEEWETISTPNLPLDTWLDVEFYLKEGDDQNGRVQIGVTPAGGSKRLYIDATGHTHHPGDPAPDGVKYSNPLKLYTSPSSNPRQSSRGRR